MVEIVALRREIAGVQDKRDAAIGMECLPDHTARISEDAVLDIAEIEETEGLRLGGGSAELQPFAPARAALQAIGIDGVRPEPRKSNLMVQGRAVGAPLLARRRGTDHLDGALGQRRAVDRDGDLRLAGALGEIGAEGDGHLLRGIRPRRQDDAIGQVARGIGRAGGPGKRGLRARLGRWCGREQQDGEDERGTRNAHGILSCI